MSSPVHKASLVDPALHSPALLELVDLKLSRPVVGKSFLSLRCRIHFLTRSTEYAIDAVAETVDFAMGRPSSSSRGRSLARSSSFATFVTNVITRAEITTPVLLASLVYIHRAKPHLHIALEEWACERVFLGAVMTASKYLNDSTLKNVHWALCTGVFGKRDVGRIEREFLDVLDFELSITEDDLLAHHDTLTAIVHPAHHHHSHSHYRPSAFRHHSRRRASDRGSDSVPELLPSSPQSSTPGSASPRTPVTLVSSPASAFDPKRASYQASKLHVEAGAPVQRHHSKKSSFHLGSSVHDLLKSFPIPHYHNHSREHSHPHSAQHQPEYPAQQHQHQQSSSTSSGSHYGHNPMSIQAPSARVCA